MINEKETIQLIKGRIMDEYRKHPDLDWAEIAACKIYLQWNELYEYNIKSLQSERDEYRQRIEENVKSIESMLHHNSVQKAEIERLRKAGDELSESHQKAMASLGTYGEHPLIESWYRKAINNWNTLTKKEVNNE